MIGLVLVSHGLLAEAFMIAMEHVVGPQEQLSAICIGPHDDMVARRDEIKAAIHQADKGDGVILVTDLFGGTPSNLAVSFMSEKVEIIAGMNLPMLIRLDGVRKSKSLEEASIAAKEAGQKYISRAKELVGSDFDLATSPSDIIDNSRYNLIDESLEEISHEIDNVRRKIVSYSKIAGSYGQIGHNLPPPPFTLDDSEILRDGEIAARIAARELSSRKPNIDVVRICASLLKRVLFLLKQIVTWSLSIGNKFITEAAKSTGKATGPALVAAAAAAGLSGRLNNVLEALKSIVGV